MEERSIWFVVLTCNRYINEWYQLAKFRSFAAARRYAEKVIDMFPSMFLQLRFEKVVYFNGSVVEREIIA